MKLLPQEIEVRYVLPALRKQFTLALEKKGIKQKEIAKLLNITPAAVSQYIKNKRGATKFQSNIQKEIDQAIEKIIKNKSTTQKEIYRISSLIRQTPTICNIHRLHDEIPEQCSLCFAK
jgi:predicted transcriptional regulator